MKKYFLILTVLALIPVISLAATRYNSGERVYLSAGETIQGNYFAAGQDIIIDGTVTGDVYVAGAIIDIKGTVEGDVFAAGQSITVSGQVNGSLRTAGNIVTISGKVGRNVTAAGESVTISEAGEVAGELLGFAAQGRFFGPVGGTVEGFYSSLLFNSTVGRNVEVTVDSGEKSALEFMGSAKVNGDLSYKSRQEIVVPAGVVTGKTTFSPMKIQPKKNLANNFGEVGWWLGKLIYLFGLLIIGILIIGLMKRKSWEVVEQMKKSIGINFLLGFLGLIVIPVAIIISFATVIGIPLGLIALFAYLMSFYLFALWPSLFIGQWLKKKFKWEKMSDYLQLLIGAIIFVVLVSLPYIGGWLYFLSMLWTWGAIYRVKKATIEEWRK